MKIRNNTNKKLVLYVGDPVSDEPAFVKELKTGEEVEISDEERGNISIQDK